MIIGEHFVAKASIRWYSLKVLTFDSLRNDMVDGFLVLTGVCIHPCTLSLEYMIEIFGAKRSHHESQKHPL